MNKDNFLKRTFNIAYPVFIWLFTQIIAIFIITFMYFSKNGSDTAGLTAYTNNNYLFLMFLASVMNIVMFLFITRKNDRIKLNVGSDYKMLAFAALLGIAFYMAVMGLINTFNIVSYFSEYQSIITKLNSGNVLPNILILSVLSPISEEFLMRGLLYNNLKKYCNVGTSIFIQALIFGIIHMNALQSSYAFLGALLLGYVYEKTDNLAVPIVLHMCINVCNKIFEIPGLSMLSSTPIIMCIIGIVIFVFVFKKFNDKVKKV